MMTLAKIHLHKLEIENFKRIRAVSLTFPVGGGVFEIAGRNSQGKSTCIDALWSALGGKSVNPREPIRRGERRAHAEVDLGDIIVRREWWATGTKLYVTEKRDGYQPDSPQAILDRFFHKLAFDPLEFTRLKAADQARILREITGLDFRAIDETRARLFAERTDVNRAVKSQEARVAEMPDWPPTEEVSVAELGSQLLAGQQLNSEREHLRRFAEAEDQAVKGIDVELARLQKLMDSMKQERIERVRKEREYLAKLESIQSIDTSAIANRLADAETINRKARAYRERQAATEELRANRAHSEDLTMEIERIDADRKRMVADAEMPVPGLSLDSDPKGEQTILFHGVPFDQVSTSEQIRVSLAMAARLNPRLRVVVIREGSLLDPTTLAMVGEWAVANDYQVLVERVADTTIGAGVVIEEGEVASVTEGPPTPLAGERGTRGKAKVSAAKDVPPPSVGGQTDDWEA